ncbi:MAG: DNA cytosine methyltransferase [bacterium]
MSTKTFGSLFAGFGGLDRGLERAGLKCRCQVENNEYANRVLAKHWPNVKRYGDIREQHELDPVDVVAGGFPCTDISDAGLCSGLAGAASGLWREMVRTVRMVRPKHTLVENVAAIAHRGMGEVLGDVAEFGHDAEWDRIPAIAFGARHIRDRMFIVTTARSVDNPNCFDPGRFRGQATAYRRWTENTPIRSCFDGGAWAREPGVARVAYGIRHRVDRLIGLGNAVFPPVAEWIGRGLL